MYGKKCHGKLKCHGEKIVVTIKNVYLPIACFQCTLGIGKPSARHSIETGLPKTELWSFGSVIHRGGTRDYCKQNISLKI